MQWVHGSKDFDVLPITHSHNQYLGKYVLNRTFIIVRNR